MFTFKKPKKNRGQQRRRIGDEDDNSDNEDNGGGGGGGEHVAQKEDDEDEETRKRIEKFKEQKNKGGKKKKKAPAAAGGKDDKGDKKGNGKSSALSFEGVEEEDATETFQVKKSSVSRRLMKQKKRDNKNDDDDGENRNGDPLTSAAASMDCEEDKPRKSSKKKEPESWTLSGREAEALHMEEEDIDDEDNGHMKYSKRGMANSSSSSNGGKRGNGASASSSSSSLSSILQSGAIPDAQAIYAARKRREAAREGKAAGSASPAAAPAAAASKDYLPINKKQSSGKSRLVREEDEHEDIDEDDSRISFTGVKSANRDRKDRIQEAYHSGEDEEAEGDEEDEEEADWEEMQIRKAMNKVQMSEAAASISMEQQMANQAYLAGPGTGLYSQDGTTAAHRAATTAAEAMAMKKPSEYNLQGIKERLKKRIESVDEVHRRHQADSDRASDELFSAQSAIERLTTEIPEITKRHRFYQELRGYVTDLVECFDEKMTNIKYLEEKFYKSKSAITAKLMERRREDVRDQMMDLSSKGSAIVQDPATQAEVASRQRRAAEREGRRRRRLQNRTTAAAVTGGQKQHNDGMSSDDELETGDKADLGKVRQEVSLQARQILVDVVEDFATVEGVMERFEQWKEEDGDSYNDAYVSLCLPKVFMPLVRMQLLFWTPFAEHNDINQQEWYSSLSTFGYLSPESEDSLASDPDRRLMSLIVEKVVLPKITAVVNCSYDPMSTTQTLRVTELLNKFRAEYPTLSGQSKQVRDLLAAVRDKIRTSAEQDLYIPIGYAKQVSESPNGPHAAFVHRQFWSCFKLLRNILAWHGLLADQILVDTALTTVLNRYLLTALGMNPDPLDAVRKCRHLVAALPREWLQPTGNDAGAVKSDLARMSGYLVQLGGKGSGGGRDFVQDVVNLLKFLGFVEESEKLRRQRLK